MQTPIDDFDLIRRYADERREDAFRELVNRHSNAVYAVCHRRLRDTHLAEDATQRTFEILARKAASIERAPIRPYLYRVATGCCADIRRAESRREKRERRQVETARMTVESKQTRLVIATMEAALENLSASYREALELRYILEFSVGEVADTLKISVPAAKQRLVRGLTELRTQMARDVNLAVIALPSLFELLQPQAPVGLADRITTAALRANHSTARSVKPKPRLHPRSRVILRLGVGTAAVACSVVAVVLPVVAIQKQTTVTTQNQAANISPLLPPTKARPVTTQPSLLAKLHRPYPSIAYHGPELQYAIDITSRVSGVPYKCDWDSIEAAGIRRTMAIDTKSVRGDALSEFQRIIDAASSDRRLECIVSGDHLLIRARQTIASSASFR